MLRCTFLTLSNRWLCRWSGFVVQLGQSENPFAGTAKSLGNIDDRLWQAVGYDSKPEFVLPVKESQRLRRNQLADSEDGEIVVGGLCGSARVNLRIPKWIHVRELWATEQTFSEQD